MPQRAQPLLMPSPHPTEAHPPITPYAPHLGSLIVPVKGRLIVAQVQDIPLDLRLYRAKGKQLQPAHLRACSTSMHVHAGTRVLASQAQLCYDTRGSLIPSGQGKGNIK